VIIPTHNRPERLERCLQQLARLKYRDFTVTIADSAPITSAAEILALKYGTEYRSSPAKGVSRARNVAAYDARSEILAYLDDDKLPHGNWLGSLIEGFTDQSVMAVCGPVVPLNLFGSNDAELANFLESAPWGRPRGGNPFCIRKSSGQWFERANFGGIGDGNFAMRRSAFLKIDCFEEKLGRGSIIDAGEEHYAYFKIIELGGTITYAPQAIVFHPITPNSKELAQKRAASGAAYAFFLMYNHPSKSPRVVKYYIEGLFEKKRWWRSSSKSETNIETRLLSKFQILLSGWSGFIAFVRSLAS
jgi:glycosyltransferase involved in cell wall biosynthesis